MGCLSFWCRRWSRILFIFFAWMRSLAVSCLKVVQLRRSSPFQLRVWFSWHQGLSSSRYSKLCPVCWCASWLLSPRPWPRIPEKVGLVPCRRFLESWSWHPRVFQTISSGQQASWCLFSLHVLYIWLPWESGVKLHPGKGGSLDLGQCLVSKL